MNIKFLATSALAGALIAPAAQADMWAEREALAKVASEVSALERLVYDASLQMGKDDRIRFDYDTLMADLQAIRGGINTHLAQPINPVMPERVDALAGNYTKANK